MEDRVYQALPLRKLPKTRTEGSRAFQLITVDFAGPKRYKPRANIESKYACSLTRAVYLNLVKSLVTSEFIESLKRFIARRGRQDKIYLDNGSTFKAAENGYRKCNKTNDSTR